MSINSFFNKIPGIQLPVSDETEVLPTTSTRPSHSATNNTNSRFSFTSLNPFAKSSPTVSIDDPTPVVVRTNEGESFINLSYFERMALFVITLLGSITCSTICITLFPILSLKPRKFALIWSLGSILFLLSFAFLNGFYKFGQHLVSKERLPFTIGYIGSILVTIFFSLIWKSFILVIVACVIQLGCAVWYTVSYFPYGRQGLGIVSNVGRDRVTSWING